MLHTAHRLAAAGYRGVLVDLRGHGRSTGDYLHLRHPRGRGNFSQVIDALSASGLVAGRSASMACPTGPRPRSTWRPSMGGWAMVAVGPFSMVRRTGPLGAHGAPPDLRTRRWARRAKSRLRSRRSDAADAIARTTGAGTSCCTAPTTGSFPTGTACCTAGRGRALRTGDVSPARPPSLWLDFRRRIGPPGGEWFDRWLKPA